MAHDHPAPPARRGPLDDLRERLARLPENHPSSPDYSARPAPGRPAAPRPRGTGDGDGPAPAEGVAPGPVPGRARAGAAQSERAARLDQLRQVDRLARLLGDRAGAAGPGSAPSRPRDETGAASGFGPLPGPRRRGGYRPWFADPDVPWFTPGD